MLRMLAGHAGDVENDADDVDGLVFVHVVRNAAKYSILLAEAKKKPSQTKPKNIPKLNLDP